MLVGVPHRSDLPAGDCRRLGLLLNFVVSKEPVAPSALLTTHTVTADVDTALLDRRRLSRLPVGIVALRDLVLSGTVGVLVTRLSSVRRVGAVIGDVE